MPDISLEELVSGLLHILRLIFGDQLPVWAGPAVGYVSLGLALLWLVWLLLLAITKIKELWMQNFAPQFYTPEEQQRGARRRLFADHVESEIRRLNRREAWNDYEFVEL